MKPKFCIIVLLIITMLFVLGCTEREIQKTPLRITYLSELSDNHKPHKKRIEQDSCHITISGKDGIKLPEITLLNLPESTDEKGVNEVMPGVSNLTQTLSEKLEGKESVISKKPDIISVDYSKLKMQNLAQSKPPLTTSIGDIVDINPDYLPFFNKIASEKGLFTIQHGDSIFPPVRIHAKQPTRIRALSMEHKDDALFDIRFMDADQELPNSYIRSIAKDTNGTVWFGSHTGGLISYDGQYFEHYNMNSGFSSDMIISLIIDSKNNFWIGTLDKGLNYFNGNKITRYTTDQGLPSNCVRAIMEDSKGNIWIGTSRGVSIFDGKTIITYTTKQGLAMNVISSICEDVNGNIWFGTEGGGVSKFDGKIFTTFTEKQGLTSNIVLVVTQDQDKNMWFGTNGGGVSKFDGQTFTNYTLKQGLGCNTILSILGDHNGNIWFGTFGNGITRYNGKTFANFTTDEGLNDNYIRTLFEDDNGNIWIGSDGGGVTNFNIHSFKHYTKEQGLSNNLVLSIFQDNKNRLWFAAFDGGLLIYDEPKNQSQTGTFTSITEEQGLANNIVLSIFQDNNNDFWFGTFGGGISKLDGNSLDLGELKFTNYSIEQGLPNEIIRSILQDNDGNIWIGSEGGATKFDGKEFLTLTKKNGLGSNKVTSIFKDHNGAIWVGTMEGGVSKLENDSIICYTTDQGLGNNSVWTIAQSNDGVMWFGTEGGGLTSFNGDYFRTYNKEDGLSNNYVFSLVVDNNNYLWAGTTRGLNQIKLPDSIGKRNSTSWEDPVIISYGKMDGLNGLDFFHNSVLIDNNDRIWWGTEKALTMLDLANYRSSPEVPIVHINSLLINEKSINFNELLTKGKRYSSERIGLSGVAPYNNLPIDLSLPHNKNHITFDFSATDWSALHQINYQYKLQGLDQEWSLLTKDNVADYRSLPSGNYIFLLKALGKSGTWSKTLSFPFIIRWPWWLSWWSIIIDIIAFAVIIWLIIKWRVNIVQKQKIILENLIFDRTKELNDARTQAEQATIAKSQFIATMSHEIRTPLNAIVGLTHLVINTKLNPKQEDYLQKIDRSAITLLSLINEILDFSKIEAGKMQLEKVNFDIEIVLNSIIILNIQHARDKNLEFVVNIDPLVPRMLVGDPLRLGQVITNLCNNAIKFTSDGEVIINVGIDEVINTEELYLKIQVIDTGIGISKKQMPLLFDEFNQADSSITRKYGGSGLGLTISNRLIEMMDGHIWVESEEGKGTTFFFDCKVGVQPGTTSFLPSVPDEIKELNLLVCDDNTIARKSLVNILHSASLIVDDVTSAEELLKQLNRKPYDLLLIDQHINGVSGIDTIKIIRKNQGDLPIKIILLTDSETDKKGVDEKTIGIDGIISKPSVPSAVLERVLAIFGMESISPRPKKSNEKQLEKIKNDLTGNTVLLAEDNAINQQVVSELLALVGVKVEIADNGNTALQLALKNSYDLILMDLHMPIIDGYKTSVEIRKQNKEIPIIAITADAMDSIDVDCKEVGINDLITKPINPDLLYNKLLEWLRPDIKNSNNSRKPIKLDRNLLFDKKIDGLDMGSSISRFGNNINLYMKMLNKFVSSNEKTCNKLEELVNNGQLEKAHLLSHTLKGESGNIGANRVMKLSTEIEQSLIDKNIAEFKKSLPLLKVSLEEVILAVKNYFKENNYSTSTDNKSIIDIITKLTVSLESKNHKTFDLLDELETSGISNPDFQSINVAINDKKPDVAINLLENLLDKFKM